MKKTFFALLFAVSLISLSGCTDSWWGSVTSLGNSHKIELYQDGEVVRTWISTGKVESGEHGTRFAFVDKETGAYTRIGTVGVVVTTLDY